MKPLSILACGELIWDLFPSGEKMGGAPVNFACHAALQGAQATILSAVGKDPRGEEALNILDRFGVDTSLVQRHENAPTGTAKVSLDSAGQPGFEITSNTAWDHIEWRVKLGKLLAEVNAVYFGTLGQRSSVARETIRRVLDLARTRKICRVLDVNLRRPFYNDGLIRESVALASVLKLSDEELPRIADACGVTLGPIVNDILRSLRERYDLQIVVLTRGAQGAILVSADKIVEQPGIPCKVHDTVGAGDSFTAALTVGLLKGEPIDLALRNACEVAAVVCSQPGAVPLPPAKMP